ncbi:hypothetical protein GN956_G4523 [Arapaima gigas]
MRITGCVRAWLLRGGGGTKGCGDLKPHSQQTCLEVWSGCGGAQAQDETFRLGFCFAAVAAVHTSRSADLSSELRARGAAEWAETRRRRWKFFSGHTVVSRFER